MELQQCGFVSERVEVGSPVPRRDSLRDRAHLRHAGQAYTRAGPPLHLNVTFGLRRLS